jgi:hypothetical protein
MDLYETKLNMALAKRNFSEISFRDETEQVYFGETILLTNGASSLYQLFIEILRATALYIYKATNFKLLYCLYSPILKKQNLYIQIIYEKNFI